jgi:hypothetical protein
MEPKEERRRGRRGSLIAPEEPGENLSKAEFDELVRDLDIETDGGGAPARPARANGPRRGAGRGGSSATGAVPVKDGARAKASTRAPAAEPTQPADASPRDPAADLTPEDLVLKDESKQGKKRPRNRRHGRAR